MGAFKDSLFSERQAASANAKKALLEKFKAKPAPDDPAVLARAAERLAIAEAREVRAAQRRLAKEEEAKRLAAEQAARDEEARARAAEEAAALPSRLRETCRSRPSGRPHETPAMPLARRAADPAPAGADNRQPDDPPGDTMRRFLILTMLLAFPSCAAITGRSTQTPAYVVFFTERSAALEPAAVDVIAQAATAAKAEPDHGVLVVGWTDSVGSKPEDVLLSQRRAQRVADALTADGVAPTRITRQGRGQPARIPVWKAAGSRSSCPGEQAGAAAMTGHGGAVCYNCATPLLGSWCYSCGQAAHDYHRSAIHLASEAMESSSMLMAGCGARSGGSCAIRRA